jgi:glycosyltransferase involved in cell wall biosynthesis
MRLAVFTPWPPDRSGIAAYSAELLPELAGRHEVHVFPTPASAPRRVDELPGAMRVWPAFDFQRLHHQAPFDVVVYQLGNARCHDYMWPYLVRYPGLVVLHDAQLHHSRARALIAAGREDDYRQEFAYSHPGAPADLAEFVVNGLTGSPYYLWPLRAVPLAAARALAVHSEELAQELHAELPADVPLLTVPMGTRAHAPGDNRPQVEGAPVFAAFGGVTHEKRVPQVLAAFAKVLETAPNARLVLVGETRDRLDSMAAARKRGVADRVTITGYVNDADLDAWVEVADVCLCLRWPTSRETSASWLRCLAAGKPTIVTDLSHQVEVPTLDPRTWEVQRAWRPGQPVARAAGAVAVAIDILDEDHSLGLAMRRLALDEPLRAALGTAARAWWEARHTLGHMVEGYEVALNAAAAAPSTPPRHRELPAHLLDSARETLERICGEMGVAVPLARQTGSQLG